ncbi:MAG: CdaR family protein [Anaerostipes sp.]|jgi:YbbR domain-containing protein|nr:CdaR family protein [Anaerostipes sp.]
MKEKIQSNLLLKVISVVLAILLWLFVINTDNPVISKTFTDIPVEMLNEQVLDEMNQTYKVTSGSTVSFTVKGKKTIIDKLSVRDFRATADVSSMSKVNAIPIKIVPLKYKDQLEITSGNSQSVKVVLEDLKQSQLPVEVVIHGEAADGYAVESKKATPNLVSISGPKSVVHEVESVRVEVNVSGLKNDINVTKAVRCYDADGDEVSQERLTLDTSKVKVKVMFARTKQVPLVVKTKGKPASGYSLGSITYSPKTVLVTGSKEALKEVDHLELTTLDVEDSTKSVEKTIKPGDIKLPDGITFVESVNDMKDFVVKANIAKEQSRTLTLDTDQIKLLNNDKNYKVTFDSGRVDVKVSGLKSVINNLSIKDLNPKIDLATLEPGVHTVQVQLKEIADMSVVVTPTVKIQIQ